MTVSSPSKHFFKKEKLIYEYLVFEVMKPENLEKQLKMAASRFIDENVNWSDIKKKVNLSKLSFLFFL